MWSKTFGRVPTLWSLSTRKNFSKFSKCCGCFCKVPGASDGHASISCVPYSSRTRGEGQTYQRWSKSHLTAILAGIGISMTTYMLWADSKRVYAAEKEKETNSSEKIDSPTDDDKEPATDTDKKKEIDWSTVPEIPSHVPYLLIGGGIASLEAFKAIKTKDMAAKVLMISDEKFPPYFRPPLSKQFWFDEDKDSYKDYSYTTSRGNKNTIFMNLGLYLDAKKLPYTETGGLALLKGTKVVRLDAVKKKAYLDNGAEITFDKCLIATGGSPKNVQTLQNSGVEVKERTTLYRNINDLWQLSQISQEVKSIAVVGGGFLGSELAVGLGNRGKTSGLKVYQMFPEKGNMAKVLPEYLSDVTTKVVEKEGVTVIPQVNIKSAVFEDGQVKLGLSDGQYLKVDHVVVAVGLHPNTDLAASAGLELDDEYGGFRVNNELQARSDIWVAGDCACFYDSKLGRRRVEHFDHAALTGRLAGFNMAGETTPYTHQSMFWSALGNNISYEAVGLVDSSLQTYSVFRDKKDSTTVDVSESTKTTDKTLTAEQDAAKSTKSPNTETKLTADKGYTQSNSNSFLSPSNCGHGVIFYLRDNAVVGVVLWNLNAYSGEPTRMDIARQVIEDGGKKYSLTEIAKLFNIYAK